MKLPLVLVEWDDAWVDGVEPVRLTEVNIEHRPKTIVTMGWLLMDDERGVSIANEHYADEDVFRGRTFIPRGMVKSVTPYKISAKRSKKTDIQGQ